MPGPTDYGRRVRCAEGSRCCPRHFADCPTGGCHLQEVIPVGRPSVKKLMKKFGKAKAK